MVGDRLVLSAGDLDFAEAGKISRSSAAASRPLAQAHVVAGACQAVGGGDDVVDLVDRFDGSRAS